MSENSINQICIPCAQHQITTSFFFRPKGTPDNTANCGEVLAVLDSKPYFCARVPVYHNDGSFHRLVRSFNQFLDALAQLPATFDNQLDCPHAHDVNQQLRLACTAWSQTSVHICVDVVPWTDDSPWWISQNLVVSRDTLLSLPLEMRLIADRFGREA